VPKKFKVMVEGVNFLIDMDNELGKYGFYTTRVVEAADETEAEALAVEMLRIELLKSVRNEASDSPVMFVEEIEELKSFDEFRKPGGGFVWYPDERKGH
jgi:hypothetical protein